MADAKPHKSSIKETLTSITIAFILAFVFRAFIIEAFVIPTGSMAPTLMGAHVRAHSDLTGYDWPVGPAEYVKGNPNLGPQPRQTAEVHDPMLGPEREAEVLIRDEPIRAGDRILVLKYLQGVFEPARFDVVVFKSPEAPQTNFIKRLVGLPNEQVALIDGDVFVRRAGAPDDPDADSLWAQPGWHIARKPERVQRTVWHPVHDAAYTPRHASNEVRRWFDPPWLGGSGWDLSGDAYRYEGAGSTALRWDAERWPIRDKYAYDEHMPGSRNDDKFPVGDLRLRAGIEPEGELTRLAGVVEARGHEFKAEIDAAGIASVSMRSASDGAGWTVLATAETGEPLEPGRVTNVEVWHVDQSIQLRIGGDLVLSAAYDWSPAERVFNATGETLGHLLAERHVNIFADPSIYRRSSARWELAGSAVTMHRVALERDLHYQPSYYRSPRGGPYHTRDQQPAAGTHPDQPVSLDGRQFFVCGDNSPASSDGRLWDAPDPWVALIDDKVGVVPKELMIGRAFLVYFPSPIWRFGLPVPDAGRLRLIW